MAPSTAPLSRALLSLDGLSVGDAFGQRQFTPEAFRRGVLPTPPWTYTDDTEMAIALVGVLARHGRVDQDDLAESFARRYAADPDRGYGGGAQKLLRQIGDGLPWRDVAPKLFGGDGSMGNGSAMRVAPLGAYFADRVDTLVTEAARSAEVTHWNDEARAGAIAVALAAAYAWNCRTQWVGERQRPYSPRVIRDSFEFVLEKTPPGATRDGIERAMEMPRSDDIADALSVLGNGSRVTCPDTVPICLWLAARHLGRYTDAVISTTAAGGDVDTNCAIVGGIVVLSDPRGVPAEWLAARETLPADMAEA